MGDCGACQAQWAATFRRRVDCLLRRMHFVRLLRRMHFVRLLRHMHFVRLLRRMHFVRLLRRMSFVRLLRRMPPYRQKACDPLFELHTDSLWFGKTDGRTTVSAYSRTWRVNSNGQAFFNGGAGAMLPSQTEPAAPVNRCDRPAACGLRLAACGVRRITALSPAQVRSLQEVFACCIILPIQGKASRLIRSAGRLRQQSMRARFSVAHAPSQNIQAGKQALPKAR